jgi:hypothetical protein
LTPTAQAFRYLGALVACALLPACSPSAGVTPTPTPAVSTPTGQSTPPETEQQRKERLDFEAAEKAYRTFRAEYDRISDTRGGSAKPTKLMTDNAAGPYLKVMSAFLRSKKAKGQYEDRRVRIAYVVRGAYSPDELVLLTCEDGTDVRVLDLKGRKVGHGQAAKMTFYVRPVERRWKIWDGAQEEVKKCEE